MTQWLRQVSREDIPMGDHHSLTHHVNMLMDYMVNNHEVPINMFHIFLINTFHVTKNAMMMVVLIFPRIEIMIGCTTC